MTPKEMARIHSAANDADSAWSPQTFADLLDSPLVFYVGDRTSFGLGRVVADEAEILTLATHPDHQRKGQGARTLALLEAKAKDNGATRIYLEVAADNIAGRALYAACGYIQDGLRKGYYRRNTGQNVNALLMSKDLTKG